MTETENVYPAAFAGASQFVTVYGVGDPRDNERFPRYANNGVFSNTTRLARGLKGPSTYHLHIGVKTENLYRLVDSFDPFTGQILPFHIQDDSWVEWGEYRTNDIHHVLIEAEQLESAIEYVSTMMRDILVPWDGTDSCNPKGQICVGSTGEDWSITFEEGELFSYDRS